MRNPDRIDPFLATLAALWKKYPDYRFGQLIMNLSRDVGGNFVDTWHWEEAEWLKAMEAYDEPHVTDEEIEKRAREFLDKLLGE